MADTALMPIPGQVDPVTVPREVTPRTDGRVDLIGLTRAQIAALFAEAGLDAKAAKLRANASASDPMARSPASNCPTICVTRASFVHLSISNPKQIPMTTPSRPKLCPAPFDSGATGIGSNHRS